MFSARKQQILRCAQDGIIGKQFFSSLLGPIGTNLIVVVADNYCACEAPESKR